MVDPCESAVTTCVSCGTDLPAQSRFCLKCGTPVVVQAVREVRKTVTLLFTDVTGSTSMGEQLDPEAYRGVMTRYFDLAKLAVEQHGGTVEKFVGDAVLAVFGVPDVREDDALRAVRAAIELSTSIASLSQELATTMGVRLEVRTGVNTGSVVTGSARAGGSFATGDAVNVAARLEQAAPPGQILIGATTHELVRDAVEVEVAGPIVAKGKSEPLVAYRLLRVLDAATGRSRHQEARMVGRDRETRTLDDALERTLESGRGHLVTILGAAGIGKSRLVSEFLGRVGDRAEVVSGRCVSYGQGITFWPVVQLLRQALGLTGGESREITMYALEQLMTDASDSKEVSDLLLPMLGMAGEPGGSDQTFWAVRRALEQLATRKPLVVTVDDLHWAEPTLLDLIERVRDEVRDLPLLLVCQARPELLDEHPNWGSGSVNSLTFGLEPFSHDQTESSLSALLGGGVPDDVVTAVTGWAGGNPLFIEEVATHLVDSGLLRRTDTGWQLTGDLAEVQVPPTVAALLAARLDRLPEDERRLVERISVIGLELDTEDAMFVADGVLDADQVSSTLSTLTRRDLLQRRRGAAGETWAFRHILVRDAAYESLPKSVRAELHARFADRLEVSGHEAGAERLAFVAHHLEQAARYRKELAPQDRDVGELTARAATTLAVAADRARDRDDLPAAMALLRRAVDLDVPSSALRRDVLVRLVQILQDNERIGEVRSTLTEYAAAMDETATALDRAHLASQLLLNRLHSSESVDPAAVDAAARLTADLARAAGDDRRLSQALQTSMWTRMMGARWESVGQIVREMSAIGHAHDRRMMRLVNAAVLIYGPQPLSRLTTYVAALASETGHSPGETARLRATAAIAAAAAGSPDAQDRIDLATADLDQGPMTFYMHILLGLANRLHGSVREAAAHLDEACKTMREAGDRAHASTLLAWSALLRMEMGDPPHEAGSLLDEAEACTSPYDVVSVALVSTGRCLRAASAGEHPSARTFADEAVATIDLSDQLWEAADIRRWLALAARMGDDPDEERRLLGEALALYRAKEIVHWAGVVEDRLVELSAPR